MKTFGSIRWRLQLWHGALLGLVVAGLGTAVWQLQLSNEYQRIDRELERHVAAVTAGVRNDDGPSPVRRPPPRNDGGPGRRPPGRPDDGNDGPVNDFYYVAWTVDGRALDRSPNAPTEITAPERPDGPRSQRTQRMRGTAREYIFFTPEGLTVLIGRDITPDLAAMRDFFWLIVGVGTSVFALGLAGGWWISTRALRPIADISATASRISTGDLSQRIVTPQAGGELADLVAVLNHTFGRLQEGFARQAQFTADASHELRTPVAVVLTQTQSTLARERTSAEYRESLEACERAARRMSTLIDSLLTLARLDAGDAPMRQACALDRIADDAVQLLRPLAMTQGIAITAACGAASCDGDPHQLGQVATNLIANAIAYTAAGGTVHVATRRHGTEVSLTVTDTGIGISAEDLPHIFERFYRADRSRAKASGRTGLGLAITKAIVDAHQGTIDVDSVPGCGTTVRVTLPAASV